MKALVLVDLQNDFIPGGALPVPEGDELIPLANYLTDFFPLVVATQDWHPANHECFAANHKGAAPGETIDLHGIRQILWPVHCVQNTHGAALHKDLNTDRVKKIIYKGTDPTVDSYSCFFENDHRTETGLTVWLRDQNVEEIYIMGLATDYCVQWTALDAKRLEFRTFVITDGCRGINLQPGDVAKALAAMKRQGIVLISSREIEVLGKHQSM